MLLTLLFLSRRRIEGEVGEYRPLWAGRDMGGGGRGYSNSRLSWSGSEAVEWFALRDRQGDRET
jgi:hypothetical protein